MPSQGSVESSCQTLALDRSSRGGVPFGLRRCPGVPFLAGGAGVRAATCLGLQVCPPARRPVEG